MASRRASYAFLIALWGALATAVIVALFLGVWSLAFISAATLVLSIAPAVLASSGRA